MPVKRSLLIHSARVRLTILLALVLLAGCTPAPIRPTASSGITPLPTSTATAAPPVAPVLPAGTATTVPAQAPQAITPSTQCAPAPIAVPTLPAVIPGYTELDPATNLHMTGTYQVLDLASYRLKITGKVDHPLVFSYDELRCMPKVTQKPVLDCPGYFTDIAAWSGVPLDYLLKLAGVQPESHSLDLVSADGYYTTVSLEDVRTSRTFLAYEWEGQPLPILHGFPLRAIFPGMSGGRWVKWLVKIEVN
jgi:DMSO/TMAO reductase YedYZ molybdopterin-dependent catalytic subunit